MSYASFLLLFVLLPAGALLWTFRRDFDRRAFAAFAGLLVIVYAATTPWDNAAVARGLWSFDPARIWGVRLWHLPAEEYLFFGLQTLLTGSWVWHRLRRLDRGVDHRADHRGVA